MERGTVQTDLDHENLFSAYQHETYMNVGGK